MTTYIAIIAMVTFIALWLITESPWKGLCYTIWMFATLLFWWFLAIAVGLLHLPQ